MTRQGVLAEDNLHKANNEPYTEDRKSYQHAYVGDSCNSLQYKDEDCFHTLKSLSTLLIIWVNLDEDSNDARLTKGVIVVMAKDGTE